MKPSSPHLAIIIVGYNSQRDLADCLPSIFASTLSTQHFTVILVDNASTDDTLTYVKKHWPQVTVIASTTNLGFAAANNRGVEEASQWLKASHVFFLNPDTILAPDCLARLYDVLTGHPETVWQPLVLCHKDGQPTDLVNTTGGQLHYLGFSYCSDFQRTADTPFQTDRPIASGAAVVFPMALLQKIGSFDPLFFMYVEDADLSWRAKVSGATITLLPLAKVWHKYSFSRNPRKFFYTERNRWFFIAKNYEAQTIVMLLPWLLINELAMLVYALFGGWIGQKLRSYGSFWRHWPHIQDERQRVQALRQRSDHDLKRYWSQSIAFAEVAIPGQRLYNLGNRLYWACVQWFI